MPGRRSQRRRLPNLTLIARSSLRGRAVGPCVWRHDRAISSRAFLARAAPIAVVTCFCSSGGGSTALMPSDCSHSSRVHPVEWYRCSSSSSSTSSTRPQDLGGPLVGVLGGELHQLPVEMVFGLGVDDAFAGDQFGCLRRIRGAHRIINLDDSTIEAPPVPSTALQASISATNREPLAGRRTMTEDFDPTSPDSRRLPEIACRASRGHLDAAGRSVLLRGSSWPV